MSAADGVVEDVPETAKVVLVAHEDTEQIVSRRAVWSSKLISEMLSDDPATAEQPPGGWPRVPVPAVSAVALEHIVRYMEHHAEPGSEWSIGVPLQTTDLNVIYRGHEWDMEFALSLRTGGAFGPLCLAVIEATSYLGMARLADIIIAAVMATTILNKTPQQVREILHIPEPTKEEEDKLRAENDWVMQIKPYNDPDKEGVDPVRPDLPQPGAETAIVATAQPEP